MQLLDLQSLDLEQGHVEDTGITLHCDVQVLLIQFPSIQSLLEPQSLPFAILPKLSINEYKAYEFS
jgi:hypothetical protein